MLITLIRPPTISSKHQANQGATPPMGIAYLASTLEKEGFSSIQAIDSIVEGPDVYEQVPPHTDIFKYGLSNENTIKRIDKDTKLIGVSCMFSMDWPITRDLINEIREHFPTVPIIAGGEHITACTEYVLNECPAIDICVLGEGEDTFLELVTRLSTGVSLENSGDALEKIAGIAFRKNGEPHLNPRRERKRGIDSIPWPSWHLLPMKKYLENNLTYGLGDNASMPLLASRGCPYVCAFCSSPVMWTTRWESRPPKDLLEEMLFYIEKYNTTNFDFYDLTPILKKSWLKEFCMLIIEHNLKITWQISIGTRSEPFDDEVFQLMKQSGCEYLTFAPESGSDEIIKAIKKKISKKKILGTIKKALEHKLHVRAFLIFGFPPETIKTCFETTLFTLKLSSMGIHEITFFNFTPYPGSEFFRELEKKGVITLNDKYLNDLSMLGDPTRVVSFAYKLSSLTLKTITYCNVALFFVLGFLMKPSRLLSLARSFFFHEHSFRYEKSIEKLLKSRKTLSKLLLD